MESNAVKINYWYHHVENYLIESRKFIKKVHFSVYLVLIQKMYCKYGHLMPKTVEFCMPSNPHVVTE